MTTTCRAFRDLVLYHPQGITDQILKSSIPDEVFPEAITFFKASKPSTTSVGIVQELLALEKYHRLIRKFTRDFISSSLSKHPITGAEVKPPWMVTKGEQYRIQRALYRFELYWKLFKRVEKKDRSRRYFELVIPLQDHSKLYFDHFPPWENEQIICIQDFLLRIVDGPFNEVAAHDVEWGEGGIYYNEGFRALEINTFRCNYLSLGLKFILRLDRVPLSKYSRERLSRDIQKLTVRDSRGPPEVWWVTHLEMASYDFVMAPDHLPLRERGYVMWDYERLSKWGLLKTPWQRQPVEPPEVARDMREKVLQSHRRRTEIWLIGGRGWWSEEDESKVVNPWRPR
ncbi:hypothetical protein MGYG_02515 [Nannizzia gypsea CBS 118893]|uniref:Uncharacterized protein n=1 Tax=Arthroderma gypseum (strain ATCC MYA-4604 / CBS 118893) TaxID=535722 RepID=E4UMY8_ARTGP|nr:hypothetical protein MGYG_02515 [Nannizzia gypsea CBS 118893]EFQ99502.1 hypothetical protein MGYG_02515 [Nannizzia gypsea CBS 118893]